jgi:DNA polymerase-3 subunit epsilon
MNSLPSTLEKIEGLNFTAIDFETANNARRSACALGVVKVVDGQISDAKHWFIKPDPFEVGFYQHRVHGIGIEVLEDKPTFPEIWQEIKPYLSGQLLVAHNLSFDMFVLKDACEYFDLDFEFRAGFCTMHAAKANWVGELSYGLSYLASRIGHQFKHHDALEDAVACALIAREIAFGNGVADLMKCPPYLTTSGRARTQPKPAPELSSLKVPDNSEISGKSVVFSGSFRKFGRKDAMKIAQLCGASPVNTINKTTDYLIVGDFSQAIYGDNFVSSKVKYARKLMGAGHKIKLMSEDEFYEKVGF